MNIDNAVVYDIETLPNVFTLHMEMLFSEASSTWEISEYRDDRVALMQWFTHLYHTQTPMIGFNSLHFDYPVIHALFMNPQMSVAEIYDKAQRIITSGDRFGHMIWDRDRFAPQIDLFKIHHFDNNAKSTSLKALQVNMRSERVVDSPIKFGECLTREQIDNDLIPYNKHDVRETKRFAHHSMDAIRFRIGLIEQFSTVEALNYNDTKIGAKILEQRLGDHVCYDRSSGRKQTRQTPRSRIALADIIFPYVTFQNPEFQRVLEYMRAQVLTPDDIEDPDATIKTKGVFTGLTANVGGIEFGFGTGGIHGSVPPQRVVATDEWLIRDIDVKGLYPDIAIKNRLAPAHLGEAFIVEYAQLPVERAKHKKGTVQNASFKLGANGAYGNSNNKFSFMYDPLFTMTVTINGQLMLCMLSEWLTAVPTFQIIQINTDGITYRIHRDYLDQAKVIEKQWEAFTLLELEDAAYSRMWIKDVNNYIAEPVTKPGSNEPIAYKQKGAYWHPDPFNYAASISNSSPPAWHKDLGNIVSIRAAVAAMTQGIDPDLFIRFHTDPFDFMLRARATGQSELRLGGAPIQKTTRYYVAREGAAMTIVRQPPKGRKVGEYKMAPKVRAADYERIMRETGGEWDERVCTKSKSRYDVTTSAIEAGYKVVECNDIRSFDFSNINYDWYIAEARKLII